MKMTLTERFNQLKKLFTFGQKCNIEDTNLEITFCDFNQTLVCDDVSSVRTTFVSPEFYSAGDDTVNENKHFVYPVFRYNKKGKDNSAILLLHGLNERSWEKYLCWAETLARQTQKPVILFPIAFHINRTPSSWYDPREMSRWVRDRKSKQENTDNLTFANLALSDRLIDSPMRFYFSGKETAANLWQLVTEIKSGRHPLFEENTSVNIFAYSIGALLSQVLLISNHNNLFSDTKLFMFCGGSLFNMMNGNSKYIMDKEAFQKITNYYQHDFLLNTPNFSDDTDMAFKSMIDVDAYKQERQNFFSNSANRIKAFSLKKDIVIPTAGIKNALGEDCADKCLTEVDFPFEYSHEVPFPVGSKVSPELLDACYNFICSSASAFLAS